MRCLLNRWVLPGLLCAGALAPAAALDQDDRPAEKPAKKAANPAEKIREQLSRPLKTEFNGQSLGAAVEHLREKTNLPISFDLLTLLQRGVNPHDMTGEVQLRADGDRAGEILRKLLNNYHLSYVILEDVLLITTEDMATHRQLRQRVNLDVKQAPLQKAVRDLARQYGVNVVVDPREAKRAQAEVSLEVENVNVETGFRLLAELADLKAARVGNVVFITNPERAEKIRKEEPTTPDFPGGVPVQNFAMPGGSGGGFGRAVPGVAVPAGPPPVAVPDAPPVPQAEPVRKQAPPRPPAPAPAPDAPVSSPPAPAAPAPPRPTDRFRP